jgi:hypothetical protein
VAETLATLAETLPWGFCSWIPPELVFPKCCLQQPTILPLYVGTLRKPFGSGTFGDMKIIENLATNQTHTASGQCPQTLKHIPGGSKIGVGFHSTQAVCPLVMPITNKHQALLPPCPYRKLLNQHFVLTSSQLFGLRR